MLDNNLKMNTISYQFLQKLKEGFNNHNIPEIEEGLAETYEKFIEYVLENKYDELVFLGRNLAIIHEPIRINDLSSKSIEISYIGQLKSFLNLCDYVTQSRVPDQIWKKIRQSKYTEPILKSLLDKGSMLASDLCSDIGLPNNSQLSPIIRRLIVEKVVNSEEIGKNKWYSLTATGRLLAVKRMGTDNAQYNLQCFKSTILESKIIEVKNLLSAKNSSESSDLLLEIIYILRSSQFKYVESSFLVDLLGTFSTALYYFKDRNIQKGATSMDFDTCLERLDNNTKKLFIQEKSLSNILYASKW